jgi:hypothetical protein
MHDALILFEHVQFELAVGQLSRVADATNMRTTFSLPFPAQVVKLRIIQSD